MCDMMLECLTIAQAQIGEQLSRDDGEYYILQTDRTTKHGHHFSTFDVATTETTFFTRIETCFFWVCTNHLRYFLEILEDLDSVRNEIGESSVSAKIIYKLKNTMSDRHSAEKLF